MQMTTTRILKKQLRKQIKSILKSITQDSLTQQSQLIHENLLSHSNFQNAKSVAVYMNMPDLEVQTIEVIKSCFELGKNVYLPRCNYTQIPGRKLNYMSMLKMPDFQSVLNLKPQGKYQLLEPTEGEDVMDTGDLDLIIVPGVSFDKTKNRMGHGAGFYDEFITTFNEKFNRRPYLLALALQEQIIDEKIPTETHDWKLDSIVTPLNTIY